ncbi:NXPE family member 2 [Amia ocellicauda]|uniref:NXPE family member 2 n=1 Tax=Amia ocellicauda TaxID=2972642 RepID=UPI00346477A4
MEVTVRDIMASLEKYIPSPKSNVNFSQSTSGKNSEATVIEPKKKYCVGETLSVLVQMRDHRFYLKTYGGDFITARIYSSNLKAAVSGVVEDLQNGTYRINFKLFWPGKVTIHLLLIHSSEAISALWRTRQQDYDKILFTGVFINGTKRETSPCRFVKSPNTTVCSYGDERDGERFYCLKTHSLPCEALYEMVTGYNQTRLFSTEENKMLQRCAETHLQCTFVVFLPTDTFPETLEKCQFGMSSPFPSGYFFQNKWFSSYCHTENFLSPDSITGCLRDKSLHFRGDSTSRQWIEYLVAKIKDLKYTIPMDGNVPRLAISSNHNFSVQWKKHAHPWMTGTPQPLHYASYIARDLDSIAGGENTVIMISVGQHLRAFPIQLFINRIISIRRGIERLLQRSPLTKVFIKNENTRNIWEYINVYNNWHGHLNNLAQKEVFKGLEVGFVDAWDMTIASNEFAVHPAEMVISNQVAIFLSYLCPSQPASPIPFQW